MCPSPVNVQPAPLPVRVRESVPELRSRWRASNPGQGASPMRFEPHAPTLLAERRNVSFCRRMRPKDAQR